MNEIQAPENLNFGAENTENSTYAVAAESAYLNGEQLAEYIKISKQNRRERKKYAEWLFKFVACWSITVMAFLLASSKGIIVISDTLLIALLTTATANVIAMFILVIKYLFNPSKST